MSDRKGSRLATSLAEQGLIEREQTTATGRRTYLLVSTTDDASIPTETNSGTPPTTAVTDCLRQYRAHQR